MIWQALITGYVVITLALIVFVAVVAPGYLPRVIFTAWLWPYSTVQALYEEWKGTRNG